MLVWDILEDNNILLDFFYYSDKPQDPAQKAKIPNKEQEHIQHHEQLMKDYFDADSTYNNWDFERRFWLRKQLVLKIIANVKSLFPYFVQKPVSIFVLFFSS